MTSGLAIPVSASDSYALDVATIFSAETLPTTESLFATGSQTPVLGRAAEFCSRTWKKISLTANPVF